MDEKPVMMKIKDIVVKMEYYPRIGLDEETVARYQELYKMGVSLPPITIQKKGHIPIDGLHRLEAQDRLGREEIAVVFEDILESEIYLRSIRINRPHGKAFSREDTKKQIRHLRFETTPSLTHKEIGKEVLLSTSRVGEICREIWKKMESDFKINDTINAKIIDGRSNLTPKENREIQVRLDAGESTSDVAADYPVGESRISQKRKESRIPKPYKISKSKPLYKMPRPWVRRWIEKRFKANNPLADIQEIDFDGTFNTDPECYHDLIEVFRRAYPEYEWCYPNERPPFNYYGDISSELLYGNSIDIQVKLYEIKGGKYAQVKGTVPKKVFDRVRDRLYKNFTIEWPLIELNRPGVFPELSDEALSEMFQKSQFEMSDEVLSEIWRSQVNPQEPKADFHEVW